jgi:hypothetical protein
MTVFDLNHLLIYSPAGRKRRMVTTAAESKATMIAWSEVWPSRRASLPAAIKAATPPMAAQIRIAVTFTAAAAPCLPYISLHQAIEENLRRSAAGEVRQSHPLNRRDLANPALPYA